MSTVTEPAGTPDAVYDTRRVGHHRLRTNHDTHTRQARLTRILSAVPVHVSEHDTGHDATLLEPVHASIQQSRHP